MDYKEVGMSEYTRPPFSLEEYNLYRQEVGLCPMGPDFVAWMREQGRSTTRRRRMDDWVYNWNQFKDAKERSEQNV